MPKILVAGDTHGNFSEVLAAGSEAEVVVLLGDQTPDNDLQSDLGPLAEKTWFLLGNHDSDQSVFLKRHESMMDRCLHRKVVDFGAIKVAGLNGVFRGRYTNVSKDTGLKDLKSVAVYETRKDFTQKYGDVPRLSTSIFWEDVEALSKLRADVLFTHEAPQTHRFGFQALGDLAQVMGVKMLVHAHHHERCDAKIGDIIVVGLAMPVSWNASHGLLWL